MSGKGQGKFYHSLGSTDDLSVYQNTISRNFSQVREKSVKMKVEKKVATLSYRGKNGVNS